MIAEDSQAVVGIVTQSDLLGVLARLLGGAGPSTRLELLVDDLPRQLSQLTALAAERSIPITSLITMPAAQPEAGRQVVVVRIGKMVAGPFVVALRAAGIQVDAPVVVVNV